MADAAAEREAAMVAPLGRERPGSSAVRSDTGEAALVPTGDVVKTSSLVATGAATTIAPNILEVAHWERLLGGELYAPLSRVDGATLCFAPSTWTPNAVPLLDAERPSAPS